MLFLVRIPTLPKRIQQNADDAAEAIKIVFDRLPGRLKGGVSIQDCSAVGLENPMDQFVLVEIDDGTI